MAISYSHYNHTAKLVMNKEVDYAALKVMLLAATAPAFDPAHTTLAQVAGAANEHEVSGNGWTAGGEPVANAAVTQVLVNRARLDGDDIEKVAAGGPIGPATRAVLIFGVSNLPLMNIDFGESKQAGDSTPFKIQWASDGILSANPTVA